MKAIKTFGTMIVIIGLCSFLTACGVSMQKGEAWLDTKKEQSEINIAGTWHSREWGAAKFNQEGKDVTGRLGDYPVKGVASGNQVYLLMYSGGTVHYSAKLLALDKNSFEGSYSKHTIVDEKDAYEYIRPITLNRE